MAEPQQDRREKPAGESGSPVSHVVLKHLGGAKEGAGRMLQPVGQWPFAALPQVESGAERADRASFRGSKYPQP